MADLSSLGVQVWAAWQGLLELLPSHGDGLVAREGEAFLESRRERQAESIFSETRLLDQRAYMRQGERGIAPRAMADALRSSPDYLAVPALPAQEADFDMATQPLIFEQRYASRAGLAPAIGDESEPRMLLSWMKPPWEPAAEQSGPRGSGFDPVHLIVFVHGFHGNAYDLRAMRNQIALMVPDKGGTRYLCSASNEEHTANKSFARLGQNLVTEVLAFLQAEGLGDRLGRLSFICHSFGGIICRAALAHESFAPLLPRLHTLITLSGPHLGMLYGTNSLVELGIWGLRKFRKAQCLTELSLKDARVPTSSFIYSLSKRDVLRHFRHVLLVSSIEDRYVPHHSARIQLCKEAIHDHRSGSLFVSMVHNLLSPLTETNLLHIEVNFGSKPDARLMSQLDSAIGRTAHISYLENDWFIKTFVQTYLPFLA